MTNALAYCGAVLIALKNMYLKRPEIRVLAITESCSESVDLKKLLVLIVIGQIS